MNIFRYFAFAAAVASVAFVSCVKDDTDGVDTAVRLTLSPAPEVFTADGRTESGAESYLGAVIVNAGSAFSKQAWDAEIVGATWAVLEKKQVSFDFTGTWDDTPHSMTNEGVEIKVEPNRNWSRSFEMRITLADGSVYPFTFTQLGEKPDAEVKADIDSYEFVAAGEEITFTYTSNMEDNEITVAYDEVSADWLTVVDNNKSVTLTASQWTNKDSARTAVVTITAGSADTSLAICEIPIVQRAADEYYFLYGASCYKHTALAEAVQFERISRGVHTVTAFFMNTADGKNPLLLNPNTADEAVYPCYAIAADGKIVEVASAGAELPQGPAIDIDGIRTLTIDMNDGALTWEWERVTNQFAMPDSELAKYKTKSYIARDGSMKEWIVEWIRWDGGGSVPMMGSGMPKSATGVGAAGTGGYGSAAFPRTWDDTSSRNLAYETTEIGGQLGDFSEYGRIYSFSEMVTGIPQNGLGFARYEALPIDWQTGHSIIDVYGDENPVGEYLVTGAPAAAAMTGNNDTDEENYPLLKIQVQGICPYGWHVANVADWLDIAYAASQASAGHTYPVSESRVTYKQFFTNSGTATSGDTNSARGIGNFASWLCNHEHWPKKSVISDGADEFGFNTFPLGWRYMTQGFQCYGSRMQAWIPFPTASANATTGAGTRLQVIIDQTDGTPNTATYAEITTLDIGQAICPFRCVKNYKK